MLVTPAAGETTGPGLPFLPCWARIRRVRGVVPLGMLTMYLPSISAVTRRLFAAGKPFPSSAGWLTTDKSDPHMRIKRRFERNGKRPARWRKLKKSSTCFVVFVSLRVGHRDGEPVVRSAGGSGWRGVLAQSVGNHTCSSCKNKQNSSFSLRFGLFPKQTHQVLLYSATNSEPLIDDTHVTLTHLNIAAAHSDCSLTTEQCTTSTLH